MSYKCETVFNTIIKQGDKNYGEHEKETKFIYHFDTVGKCNNKDTFHDSSKTLNKGQPVESIYGRKFKLEVWEQVLASMRRGEIRKFAIVDDESTHEICVNYIETVKCFRKHFKVKQDASPNNGHNHDSDNQYHHSCSLGIQNHLYKDLNELIHHPPELFVFTLELVEAISPNDYPKDVWQMTDEEKSNAIDKLRHDGNEYYSKKDYPAACESYAKCLNIIETLLLKEKPRGDEWLNLDALKTPVLLNLSQAKLAMNEYYDAIKLTNEVLQRDPSNIKALFRRAKANSQVWNFDESIQDYEKCLQLDETNSAMITKCIKEVKGKKTASDAHDRGKFKNMF